MVMDNIPHISNILKKHKRKGCFLIVRDICGYTFYEFTPNIECNHVNCTSLGVWSYKGEMWPLHPRCSEHTSEIFTPTDVIVLINTKGEYIEVRHTLQSFYWKPTQLKVRKDCHNLISRIKDQKLREFLATLFVADAFEGL